MSIWNPEEDQIGAELPPADPFAGLDPRVAQYMKNKMSVKDAQDSQDRVDMLSAGAKVGDALVNSQLKPTIFENRMQDLGSAPKMQQAAKINTDLSGLQAQAKHKLDTARSDESDAVKMAFEQKKADLMQKVAADRLKQGLDIQANQQKFTAGENDKNRASAERIANRKSKEVDPTAQLIKEQHLKNLQDNAAAKEEALKINGYGYANTPDDAKQLKEAIVSKSNFDSKLKELIDLRTDKSGGAIWDREAVARGKQLSKDLLLEYKNMQKLGVLSKSDEAIVNAIIPSDPLEYNSPVAAIQGQDPILNNMKKFKTDSENDFKTQLKTRLKSNKGTTVKMIDKNGKPYNIPAGEAAEAELDGFKRVE